MLYINFIKYLFYISEYKRMLIKLLICHITKSADKNTVKEPNR